MQTRIPNCQCTEGSPINIEVFSKLTENMLRRNRGKTGMQTWFNNVRKYRKYSFGGLTKLIDKLINTEIVTEKEHAEEMIWRLVRGQTKRRRGDSSTFAQHSRMTSQSNAKQSSEARFWGSSRHFRHARAVWRNNLEANRVAIYTLYSAARR